MKMREHKCQKKRRKINVKNKNEKINVKNKNKKEIKVVSIWITTRIKLKRINVLFFLNKLKKNKCQDKKKNEI